MEWEREKGYEVLERVLFLAYKQASEGKGKDRHAGVGVPFSEQPIITELDLCGIGASVYQIRKKAQEVMRLPKELAMIELLDIIVYACAAYLYLEGGSANEM